MDRSSPSASLPEMSYTSTELKPRAGIVPTEAQVRERAHQIWLEREGEAGNPTLDWLQAEMELVAELRTGRLTPGRTVESKPAAGRPGSVVEARPDAPAQFERADVPRGRARAA